MTNLPFVFSKYQTTLLHEIYTVCQYFDSLCSKQIHTTRGKEIDNSERLLKCLL